MDWLLFISQLPAHPSSLRVNVWRKLRAAGAMGLQNGAWVLPNRPEHTRFLCELLESIQSQGASGQIFNASPFTQAVEDDILARFRADRAEEYHEFGERCQDFQAEICKETANQKFTFAELEDIEQELQKLETWLEKIRRRDFSGGAQGGEAARRFETVRAEYEAFSREIYQRQVQIDDTAPPSTQPTRRG